MTVPSTEYSTLVFYVTVGRGTECFAESEIKNVFSDLVDFIHVRDGKILFKIGDRMDDYLDKILSLKSVERAFVAVTDYKNAASGKRNFLDQLMQTMSDSLSFAAAIKVLEQLSSLSRKRKLKGRDHQFHFAKDARGPPSKQRKLNNTSSDNCPNLQCDPEAHAESVDNIEVDLDCKMTCYKTFRMSVKCSGKSARWINGKKLSKDLSWRVSRASKWIVDLRKPDFEICLHISDGHVTAGVPLTSKPLSRRPFITDPGLRGPVAWIMVQLADIKPGDVILDPMCGKGTLILEACSDMKDASYTGTDIDASQIEVARHNVTRIGYQKHIDLLLADGLCLPFRSSSVNRVLCDAPFNQKHSTSTKPEEFYISFFEEMYRVLEVGGKFVLLTSQELSRMIVPLLEADEDYTPPEPPKTELSSERKDLDSILTADCFVHKKFSFRLLSSHYMKLGETHGKIIVMVKL